MSGSVISTVNVNAYDLRSMATVVGMVELNLRHSTAISCEHISSVRIMSYISRSTIVTGFTATEPRASILKNGESGLMQAICIWSVSENIF